MKLYGKFIEEHQGNYPVIFLTLKSLQDANFYLATSHDDETAIQAKLEQAAGEALQQIQMLSYVSEAKAQSTAPILQVALTFCGKQFVLKSV